MTTLHAAIAAKLQLSTEQLDGIKSAAVTMAANPLTTAQQWTDFANNVANYEGRLDVWARLNLVATNKGDEFTQLDVARHLATLLSEDSGDSYSGRGNEVRRAQRDGQRFAAQEALWV
jgi:hypothetical protein